MNFRRSVIIAELWRPEDARPGIFWGISALFEKNDTLRWNFHNYCVPKVYMATPIDVVVFKFRKICPTGNRWNRALFSGQKKTKFCLLLKLSLLRGSRQNLPGPAPTMYLECANFHPNWFKNMLCYVTFCYVIAELAYSRTRVVHWLLWPMGWVKIFQFSMGFVGLGPL